jgi:hypothetical protein
LERRDFLENTFSCLWSASNFLGTNLLACCKPEFWLHKFYMPFRQEYLLNYGKGMCAMRTKTKMKSKERLKTVFRFFLFEEYMPVHKVVKSLSPLLPVFLIYMGIILPWLALYVYLYAGVLGVFAYLFGITIVTLETPHILLDRR